MSTCGLVGNARKEFNFRIGVLGNASLGLKATRAWVVTDGTNSEELSVENLPSWGAR